jgi:F-type H+-transporting ATPase subunit delta
MSILIAKRYVKALIEKRDIEVTTIIEEQLQIISSAYINEKFLSIISSVDVTIERKVELILSFIDEPLDAVKNLIVLLGQNRRLDIIPAISKELKKQIAVLKNSYDGVVYSNESLSSDYLTDMENSFSKKFNIELSLKNVVCDYDGIKVDIDGLGIEIGFSQERLKSQMIDHILKAV